MNKILVKIMKFRVVEWKRNACRIRHELFKKCCKKCQDKSTRNKSVHVFTNICPTIPICNYLVTD